MTIKPSNVADEVARLEGHVGVLGVGGGFGRFPELPGFIDVAAFVFEDGAAFAERLDLVVEGLLELFPGGELVAQHVERRGETGGGALAALVDEGVGAAGQIAEGGAGGVGGFAGSVVGFDAVESGELGLRLGAISVSARPAGVGVGVGLVDAAGGAAGADVGDGAATPVEPIASIRPTRTKREVARVILKEFIRRLRRFSQM